MNIILPSIYRTWSNRPSELFIFLMNVVCLFCAGGRRFIDNYAVFLSSCISRVNYLVFFNCLVRINNSINKINALNIRAFIREGANKSLI